jgi:HEAT repeat protein
VDFLLTSSSEQATVLLRRAGGGDVGVAAQLALIGRGEELPYFAVESLLSADREVRALACEVLGLWLEGADSPPRRAERLAHEALLKSLEDLEEQVRLEAIRALGRSGRAADASALAPLVMSEEPGWQGVVASAALLKLVSGTR